VALVLFVAASYGASRLILREAKLESEAKVTVFLENGALERRCESQRQGIVGTLEEGKGFNTEDTEDTEMGAQRAQRRKKRFNTEDTEKKEKGLT